jgi:glycine cleavage system H protein
MKIPDNFKYSKDHEWVKIEDGVATIGITDYAQSELGDIVFVEFPEIDNTIEVNEVFGTVEAVKTVADLFSPTSGTVIEINEELEDAPELINSSPYDEGWLIKVNITNVSELTDLMNAKEYEEHIS